MSRSARSLLLLLFFLVPLLSASDDQQKAHKLTNKVTAMSTDPSGRRAVNLAMSQCLSVNRKELVQRRQAMNVNYGDIFVAYELAKSGTKMDDVASMMKAGKTVWQTADELHSDWKQIANDAKKLNSKVDSSLIGHFLNPKAEVERDRADGYDSSRDTVKADGEVSAQEVADAQQRYIFLRDHAGAVTYSSLDTSTEKAAQGVRTDPVRTAGPIGNASAPKN
jgi:hypothetical protein